MRLEWRGSGVEERGVAAGSGRTLIKIDPRYFRPTEVDTLLGDASKARQRLGWQPQIGFEQLVRRWSPRIWRWRAAMRSWPARASRPISIANSGSVSARRADLRRRPQWPGRLRPSCGGWQPPAPAICCCARARELDLRRQDEVERFFEAAPPAIRVPGGGEGRRHRGQPQRAGAVPARQSADPDQRHRCGVSPWGPQAAVPGLQLHLPARRPAADDRGVPAHRAARAHQRVVCDRQDRGSEDVPGIPA